MGLHYGVMQPFSNKHQLKAIIIKLPVMKIKHKNKID